jgi:hypothetical protein
MALEKPGKLIWNALHKLLAICEEFVGGQKALYRNNPAFARALRIHGFKLSPHYSIQNYIGTERDSAYVAAVLDALAHPEGLDDPYKIAGFLTGTKTPFDGRFLIKMYEQAPTELMKQNIVLRAIQTQATGIDSWLRGLIQDRNAPMARNTVIILADLLRDKEGLTEEMLLLFEEFPRAVIDYCGKCGGKRELEFLRSKQGWSSDLPKREARMIATALKHAIGLLERRVARQAARTAARQERLTQKDGEKQRLREEKQRLKEERAQAKRGKP